MASLRRLSPRILVVCAVDKLNPMAPRTLVIEGDPDLAEVIRHTLEEEGHQVLLARSWGEGTKFLEQIKPDLLIIDEPYRSHLYLGFNGLARPDAPPAICIVQEAKAPGDRWGYHEGDGGWLAKPFLTSELLYLVRLVHQRRSRALLESLENRGEPYQDGRLAVDFTRRRCIVAGQEIHLSPTEFRLLAVLVGCANQVVSQRQLLSMVWGPEYLTTTSGDIVRQAVHTIRIKLRQQSISPNLIETVRGQGYTYCSNP